MESTKSENFTNNRPRKSRVRRILEFYQDSAIAFFVTLVLVIAAIFGAGWLILLPQRDAENRWAKAWQLGKVQISNTSIPFSETGKKFTVVSAPLPPSIVGLEGYEIYGVYRNPYFQTAGNLDDQPLPRSSSVKTNSCVNFYPQADYTAIHIANATPELVVTAQLKTAIVRGSSTDALEVCANSARPAVGNWDGKLPSGTPDQANIIVWNDIQPSN